MPPRATGASLLLLFAICFIAYFPTLRNGYIWDDDYYIQNNVQLRDLGGLRRIWLQVDSEPQYYPVTHTSFWIEYQLWGQSPLGYHLDNILLQACSSILLWRVLLLLKIPGAYLAALLFAIHPVQVETVAWVTERKNLLSGLFYLLSLLSYLNSPCGSAIAPQAESESQVKSGVVWYLLSLLLYCGAILSKSVTVTLPAVILLLAWWKRGKIVRRDLWPLLPMFVAGIAMGWLTSWMEKHVVGAMGSEFDLSVVDRMAIAGRALWFYLLKLLWPVNLIFIYPRWKIDPLLRPWLLIWPLAAVAGLLALSLLRGKLGRGPLAGFLFFAGTLAPALGFVSVFPMRYSFVADHFQYLAAIGPIVLFAAVFSRHATRPLLLAAASLLIGLFCILDIQRCEVYRDRQTLWRDTIARNPRSPMAQANYGEVLFDHGNVDGAEPYFRRAMQLRQGPTDAMDIGRCYASRKSYAPALGWYQLSYAVMPQSSEPVVRRLRARPLMQIGNVDVALAHQAAAGSPRDAAAVQSFRDRAIDAYQRTIELDPQNVQARLNLGLVLAEAGRLDAAIEQYQQALQIDHGNIDAMNNIGTIRMMQGRWEDAIIQFKAALQRDPSDGTTQYKLMQAEARRGE